MCSEFEVGLAGLIAGARSTQEAGYATFTRVVLTLAGAFAAAFLVALLDALTGWKQSVKVAGSQDDAGVEAV